MSADGVRRGGRHAIIDADEEQRMRDLGMPVRCCDYWPECSHMLAWVENRDKKFCVCGHELGSPACCNFEEQA